MKVLVIGGGGREHALVWKLSQSPLVKKIYCAPGNPGMAALAECRPIAADDLNGLAGLAQKEKIDLTVVGPEVPLVMGIADLFTKKGLPVFGPEAGAALLEGSKAFSKKLMREKGIPTADFAVFNEAGSARDFIEACRDFPVVLKADGLAAGKGVLICHDRDQALRGVDSILADKTFGNAGNTLLIEQFIRGDELSLFVLTDGKRYLMLPAAQDHKKIGEGDTGANTGGMGAYAPAPLGDRALLDKVATQVVEPTLEAMRAIGHPYRGLLYVGLIIREGKPFVLEYNCRFGDPETQAVLPLIEDDLAPVFMQIARGRLETERLKVSRRRAFDVVIASGGYPAGYTRGHVISGLDGLPEDILCFHAGTAIKQGQTVTAGGRVLNLVALDDTFSGAAKKAYAAIRGISFRDMYYRRDIGYKVLESGS